MTRSRAGRRRLAQRNNYHPRAEGGADRAQIRAREPDPEADRGLNLGPERTAGQQSLQRFSGATGGREQVVHGGANSSS